MPSDERKALQEVQARLRELRADLLRLNLGKNVKPGTACETPELEDSEELSKKDHERYGLEQLVKQYESHRLIREAQNWGIDVKREWTIDPSDHDPDAPGAIVMTMPTKLNDFGMAVITKRIRDERFAYWKGWAEIVVPILALIIAIISLLK